MSILSCFLFICLYIADTLQLFLPIFPDSEVRKRGVEWLEEETTDREQNKTSQLVQTVLEYQLKGTVSVISCDPTCKDDNARIITVILKILI